jgi:hypothetical protein
MNNRYVRFLLFTLAGKLVSELVGKEKKHNKNSLNLASFIGVIEVKHSIRGRVRLYVPVLKNDEASRRIILEQLSRVETIKHIEINNITGSLTIKYDPEKIDPALLIGVVAKLLQLEGELVKKKESLITREMGNMKEAVNLAIYNKTRGIADIKAIYILIVLFFGIRGIRQMPKMLPNGYTMVRWAYAGL